MREDKLRFGSTRKARWFDLWCHASDTVFTVPLALSVGILVDRDRGFWFTVTVRSGRPWPIWVSDQNHRSHTRMASTGKCLSRILHCGNSCEKSICGLGMLFYSGSRHSQLQDSSIQDRQSIWADLNATAKEIATNFCCHRKPYVCWSTYIRSGTWVRVAAEIDVHKDKLLAFKNGSPNFRNGAIYSNR